MIVSPMRIMTTSNPLILTHNMKFYRVCQIGEIVDTMKGCVSTWKADPTNYDAAIYAAYHYAKRRNETMLIIPENGEYKIVARTDKLSSKVKVNGQAIPVLMVHVTGKVNRAIVEE